MQMFTMNIHSFIKHITQISFAPTRYKLRTFNYISTYGKTRCIPTNTSVTKTCSASKIKFNVTNCSRYVHTKNTLQLVMQDLFKHKETITEEQALLFLRNCVNAMPNQSPKKRIEILNMVYERIKNNELKCSVLFYNTYIELCTEYDFILNCSNFLSSMQCEPNPDTYTYLLANVCEKGDIEQASLLLNMMKDRNLPIDVNIFNLLMLGYSIHGGLYKGEEILIMMQASQVPRNNDTTFSLYRGLIIRDNYAEFEQALQKYSLHLNEQQFLKLLYDAGVAATHMWLPKIMELIDSENFSRNITADVENACINLIYSGKPKVAILVYKSLIKSSSELDYAAPLIQEMLNCNVPAEELIEIIKDLKESGKNLFAVEAALGIALKNKHMKYAWMLLEMLSCLRPHFFWPLLLHAGHESGELGIFNTLRKMNEMNTKADAETLEFYCLPFCDLSDPKNILMRIQSLCYTTKELLTPIIAVLLYNSRVVEGRKLADEYSVRLQGERLLPHLSKSWKNGESIEDIVKIIQKICESGSRQDDWTGQFLHQIVRSCRTTKQFEKFLFTLKLLHKQKLSVSPATVNVLSNLITQQYSKGEHSADIHEALDSLLDLSIIDETGVFIHPRYMNIEQLECHLVELENKNMNTRGILRRLIQMHNNLGNVRRVEELEEKFLSHGYAESPGIKAAKMHSYIQSRNLNQALDLYHEIKALHPHFKLDSFKILDLAALMVSKDLVQDAIDLIESEGKKRNIRGGPSIERNCWRLLNATEKSSHAEQLLQLLTTYGYCKVSNTLLGPLIRVKLKCNLKEAVEAYVQYSKTYKCTPLKVELLGALLEAKENELFNKAVKATEGVYGKPATNLSVVAALAEKGMEKSLRKFLSENPVLPSKEVVYKEYNYWVREKKILPLLIIARAASKLHSASIDLPFVYLSILKIYSEANDCESAVAFWRELEDEAVVVSDELRTELCNLLKRCKYYDVPENLGIKIG